MIVSKKIGSTPSLSHHHEVVPSIQSAGSGYRSQSSYPVLVKSESPFGRVGLSYGIGRSMSSIKRSFMPVETNLNRLRRGVSLVDGGGTTSTGPLSKKEVDRSQSNPFLLHERLGSIATESPLEAYSGRS